MAYDIFQAMTAARSAAAQFGADGPGGGASAAGVGGCHIMWLWFWDYLEQKSSGM